MAGHRGVRMNNSVPRRVILNLGSVHIVNVCLGSVQQISWLVVHNCSKDTTIVLPKSITWEKGVHPPPYGGELTAMN